MRFLHSNYINKEELKKTGLLCELSTAVIKDLERFLKESKVIALDIETTGLDPYKDTITLIQLCNTAGEIHLVVADKVGQVIKLLNQYERKYIIHNSKFDLSFLFKNGLLFKSVKIIDTMLIESLLTNSNKNTEKNLKALLIKYLGKQLDKEDQKSWINLNFKNITGSLIEYACNDVIYLHDLLKAQQRLIIEKNLKEAVILEFDFVKCLTLIELNGIKLDKEVWRNNIQTNVEIQNNVLENIEGVLLGKEINLNSPAQIKKHLKELGYDLPTNKDGKETTSKDKLKQLKSVDTDKGFLKYYLSFKEVNKLVNAFGETYYNNINTITGRIHCSFRQILSTTRLSSSKPNMQNLPRAAAVRSAFVAKQGYKLITADYSSQEIIVLADLAKETSIIEFYKNGVDIHSKNATIIYKALNNTELEITKDVNPIWKDNITYRDLAKKVVFKLNYGGSAYTLQTDLSCDESTANSIIEALNQAYYNQTLWQVAKMKKALDLGYIEFNDVTKAKYFWSELKSIKGELLSLGYFINTYSNVKKPFISKHPQLKAQMYNPERIKEIRKEFGKFLRCCQNYPIQATGANIMKQAIINITEKLTASGIDVQIVNTVHDEIVLEVEDSIVNDVMELVRKEMIKAGNRFIKSCEIKVDISASKCWSK